MISFALAMVLAAPPAAPLPEISAPLGHIGNVVEAVPKGGLPVADRVLVLKLEGCEPQAVYLMRYLGGAARALEQLQQWLDASGLERKLFARKSVLSGVMRHLSDSRAEDEKACKSAPLADDWRLALDAPPKLCPAEAGRTLGDFWFKTKGVPAAVVQVSRGAPDVCRPRLSAVLFDPRGIPRVRLHADWGGEMSATLLGDKCQQVDYTFNKEKQSFTPTLKSCKR